MGVIPDRLEPLVSLSLAQLNAKWTRWLKLADDEYDNPGMLMSYQLFLELFGLPHELSHELFM